MPIGSRAMPCEIPLADGIDAPNVIEWLAGSRPDTPSTTGINESAEKNLEVILKTSVQIQAPEISKDPGSYNKVFKQKSRNVEWIPLN